MEDQNLYVGKLTAVEEKAKLSFVLEMREN